jgi:putative ABC transport system permease protein
MNIFILVWNYLKARPLNTAINIVLLSLGIAVICILLIFNRQLEQKITTNSKGIDLVIGAKGSPLQIILCNIFHIDFPTGNIPLREAERIARNRLVKRAIPLALGDSYESYRIVGTNRQYPALYNGELAEGKWFDRNLEVTIGSTVAEISKLRIGDHFASAHGLTNGGHTHNEHEYVVSGIMKPSYTVLDNVILTRVESIWTMHEEVVEGSDQEHEAHDEHARPAAQMDSTQLSKLVPTVLRSDSTRELTAMLVQYRSPMGAIQLPRIVNSQSSLQAASPAFETARLFSLMGVGVDMLMAFAYVLILISGLSIFIALYNSLKERRYDMAILRSMGASRTRLLVSILLEGGLLTLLGCVIGLLMGHCTIEILATLLPEIRKAGITGIAFYPEEWIILVGSLLLGLMCALLPAVQAYKTDISKVLAGNA